MDSNQEVQPASIPEPVQAPAQQSSYYGKRNWKKWLAIYAVVAVLIYGAIYYYMFYGKSNPYNAQTTYNKLTSIPSPTTSDPTANWKTYTSSMYTLKYPAAWYANEYTFGKDAPGGACVDFSDVTNSQDIPGKISPENHQIVTVCTNSSQMPKTFPYTNGSSKNETIQPFSINGYTGIKGKTSSVVDVVNGSDVVLLQSPKAGYVQITRALNATDKFDQILSTFKFTDSSASASPTPMFCGGIANIQCPRGYNCMLDSKNPDAGGHCVEIKPNN